MKIKFNNFTRNPEMKKMLENDPLVFSDSFSARTL